MLEPLALNVLLTSFVGLESVTAMSRLSVLPACYAALRAVNFASNSRFHLCLLAIFKNESDDLPEWIEYHLVVGVEHFHLQDHVSQDNPQFPLARYIQSRIVTYVFCGLRVSPHCNVQMTI
jgi:hypothetical protein